MSKIPNYTIAKGSSVNRVTNDQSIRLWRNGVPMAQAWVTYAKPDLKERWAELQQRSASDAFEKGAAIASASEGDAVAKIQMALEGPQKILGARTELRKILQTNILKYIAGGHLHGFGYELPRKLSDAPVAIPKAAWAGRCDWTRGELSYRGLEFVDIRLTTNRIRNEVLERGHVDTRPTRPQGRPSVAPEIKKAFFALHEAGKIDPKASLKSHYSDIRRWLELNCPNLPVPPAHINSETIRKNISPLFKVLRETKKQ
ncbi:hypothetical protein [Ruegeria arenilitoris]|uniref:hypothetical protein n=1 Tax=Ruegeria arenilitoris TaxID=1173585 RepID=UPI001C2C41B2|nr:hypothetical protein [Ruegeria arenilitoris]